MIIGTDKRAEQVLEPFFAAAEGELLIVLHLGSVNRLLALTIEEQGSADEVELPVPAILAKALRIGARGLILAHNHPSGDPTRSRADEAATRALTAAAAHVEVRVHEHLVFGGGKWCSFRELGLL